MDEKLKLLSNSNLVFIDIEATDDKNNQEIIQFGAIRWEPNNNCKKMDYYFKTNKKLSTYIINLLRIDDDMLKNQPKIEDKKQEIIDFIKDATIISFGNWDCKFLGGLLGLEFNNFNDSEINNGYAFDFQNYLNNIQITQEIKKQRKMQLPLLQTYYFLFDDKNSFLHNASFDAQILKDVFFKICEMNEEEIEQLKKYAHLMPRTTLPYHKIFLENEFKNKWTNIPKNNLFIIDKLETKKFDSKKNKQIIHYLTKFNGYFYNSKRYLKYECNWKIYDHGLYDIYLEDVNRFINTFLKETKNSGIIFKSANKDKIQHFCEIIYDASKIYCEMNYINLSSLKLRNSKNDINSDETISLFHELIYLLSNDKRKKFIGYYEKNNC